MAFNGNTSPALSEAQVEQLFELRRRRAALTAEINRILGSVAQVDRPSWHCERCGHTWKGMWRNRKPRHCSKCHAANWDRPSPKKANGQVEEWRPPWMNNKVTVEPLNLTPPPPPVPIPEVTYPQPVVKQWEKVKQEDPDIGRWPVDEQIEATQEKARAVAVETLMQEPQPCTAHRFIDGVCLFCGDPQPEEAT